MNSEFANKEVKPSYGYPSGYTKPKSIAEQVRVLCEFFPDISFSVNRMIAEQPLPQGAEGWFAIPMWQSIGKTYEEALFLKTIERNPFEEIFYNLLGRTPRPCERTVKSLEVLSEAQKGYNVLVIAAQFGLRHRGCSAFQVRKAFEANEFGLGSFAVACMILTHRERLSSVNDLGIDCVGDSYKHYNDGDFSFVPYFKSADHWAVIDDRSADYADECYGAATAFLP